MHESAELLFHAIIGLLRALWAVCEFVLQILGEAASDGLIEAFCSRGPSRRQRVRSDRTPE